MHNNSSDPSKGLKPASKRPTHTASSRNPRKKSPLLGQKREIKLLPTLSPLLATITPQIAPQLSSPLLTQLRAFSSAHIPTSKTPQSSAEIKAKLRPTQPLYKSNLTPSPDELKAKLRPTQQSYKSNLKLDLSTANITPNPLSAKHSTAKSHHKDSTPAHVTPRLKSTPKSTLLDSLNTTPTGSPKVRKSASSKLLELQAADPTSAASRPHKSTKRSKPSQTAQDGTVEAANIGEGEASEGETQHDEDDSVVSPGQLLETIVHFQQRIAVGYVVERAEIEEFLDLCLQSDCPQAVIEAWNIFDTETYSLKDNKELLRSAQAKFGLKKSELKPPQIPTPNLNVYSTTIYACALLGSANLAFHLYTMMGVDQELVDNPYDDDTVTRLLNLTLNNNLLKVSEHNNVAFSLYTDLCYDISNHLGVSVEEVHKNFDKSEKDTFAYLKLLDCFTNPDQRYSHRLTQELIKNPYASHPVHNSEELKRDQHKLPPRPERRVTSKNPNTILLDPNAEPLHTFPAPTATSFASTLVLLACIRSAQNLNATAKSKKIAAQRNTPGTRKYQSRKDKLAVDTVLNSTTDTNDEATAEDLLGEQALPDTDIEIDETIRAVMNRVLFHDTIKVSPSHISLAVYALYTLSMRFLPSVFKIFTACAYRQLPVVPQTLFALMHSAKEANCKFHLFTYFDMHFIQPNLITFATIADGISNVQTVRRHIIEQGKNMLYTQRNPHAMDWFATLDPFSKQMYHSDGGSYGITSRFGHLLFPNFLHVVSTVGNMENRKRSASQIWGALLEAGKAEVIAVDDNDTEKYNPINSDKSNFVNLDGSDDLIRPSRPPTVLNEYSPYDQVPSVLAPKETKFAVAVQRPIFYSFIMVLSAMRGLPYAMWARQHDAAPTLWRESLLLSEILSQFTSEPDRYVFSLSIESAMNANQAEPVLFLAERLLNRNGRVRVRLLDSLLTSLQPHHLTFSPKQQQLLLSQYTQDSAPQKNSHNVYYSNSDSPQQHSQQAFSHPEQPYDIFQSPLHHVQHTTQNQLDAIIRHQVNEFFNLTSDSSNEQTPTLPTSHPISQHVQLPILDTGLNIIIRMIEKAMQEPIEYTLHQKRTQLKLPTHPYGRPYVSLDTNLELLRSRVVEFESEDEKDFEILKFLKKQVMMREDFDTLSPRLADQAALNVLTEFVGVLDENSDFFKLFNVRALSSDAIITMIRSISGSGNALLSLSMLAQILNISSPVSQLFQKSTLPPHLQHLAPTPSQFGAAYNPNAILTKLRQHSTSPSQSSPSSSSPSSPSKPAHHHYKDSLIPTSLQPLFNTVQALPQLHAFLDEAKFAYIYTLDFETLPLHLHNSRPLTKKDQTNFLASCAHHPHLCKMSSRDMSTLASQTLLSVALSTITHNTPVDIPSDHDQSTNLLRDIAATYFSTPITSHAQFGSPEHRRITTLAFANLLTWTQAQVGQKPTTLNFLGHLAALISISQISANQTLVHDLTTHTSGGTLEQRLEWIGLRDKKVPLIDQIATTLKTIQSEADSQNLPELDDSVPVADEKHKKKPRRRQKVPFAFTFVHDMRRLEGKLQSRTSYRASLIVHPERSIGMGYFSDQYHRGQLHHVYLLAIEALMKSGVILDFPDECQAVIPDTPDDVLNLSPIQTRNYARDSHLYSQLIRGESGAAALQLYNLAKRRFNWKELTTAMSHLITMKDGTPKYAQLSTIQSVDQWLETLPWLPSAYSSTGYQQGADSEEWSVPSNSITISSDVLNSLQTSNRSALTTQLEANPVQLTSYEDLFVLNKIRSDTFLLDFRQMSVVHSSVAFTHAVHQLMSIVSTNIDKKSPSSQPKSLPPMLLLLPTMNNRDHVFPDTQLISPCCTSEFILQTDHFSSLFPDGMVTMDKIYSSTEHNIDIFEVIVAPQ